MEELRCIGCGSVIQSVDPKQPGYIPESKLKETDETIVCRRCFRLKHYNEITPLEITKEDFYRVVSMIGKTQSLVVKIIDIFDIEGSMIPQITKLTNHNDLVVIANKSDLLPQNVKESKLLHHLRKMCSDYNLKPQAIHIMSALKYKNIDSVIDSIMELSKGRDIYIVGATNVGKSTFINTILKAYADAKQDVITVSKNAGTTLDFIKIPIGDQYIIDTPGIINEGQLTHYLSHESLKIVTPKKEIKPKIFQLTSEQTLFINGFARIDFIEGEPTSFVCYFSEFVTIHRTKLSQADELYQKHKGALLSPPSALETYELVSHKLHVGSGKQDVVFPGLGFITIKGPVDVIAYTAKQVRPYIREALI